MLDPALVGRGVHRVVHSPQQWVVGCSPTAGLHGAQPASLLGRRRRQQMRRHVPPLYGGHTGRCIVANPTSSSSSSETHRIVVSASTDIIIESFW